MNKVGQVFASTRNFFDEVIAELKKCAWPTRPELFESTVVVIVSVFLLAMAVGVSDLVLMWLMRLVIR